MAAIKPFAALKPKPELAQQICALPYDVMSRTEARAMAQDNPLSFLHISRPEIDLPDEVNPYDASVYKLGRRHFQKWIADRSLVQDDSEHYYFYRQVMGGHQQTGLVAVAGCQDYLDGIIKKHERTRPAKEDDRVRHIESLSAQTGPVFLTYPAHPELNAVAEEQCRQPPRVDFTAEDGVRHTAWDVTDPDTKARIEGLFAAMDSLYIADGHHRSAAAGRVFETRQGAGGSHSFLAVLFPHDQMQILAYNRAVLDLNGLSPAQVIERLEGPFIIDPNGPKKPTQLHEVGCYIAGQWMSLRFRDRLLTSDDPVEQLDVTLLQRHVLDPMLGIDDPRTSDRIEFVGGIRGTEELERLVDTGHGACAFSMFPTRIEDLMAVSDRGSMMPPKSTWFEPKLRDAMFCHLI